MRCDFVGITLVWAPVSPHVHSYIGMCHIGPPPPLLTFYNLATYSIIFIFYLTESKIYSAKI